VGIKEEVGECNAEGTDKEEREATRKRNEEPKKRSRTENESAEAQGVPDDWVKVGPSCSHVTVGVSHMVIVPCAQGVGWHYGDAQE